jgi:4'-phosphopantetheinyl transferase
MTIFPVVLPITEAENSLVGKKKIALLKRTAREALRLSAEKSGTVLGELKKDKNDVPLPSDGVYWSLSHKTKYVAAVASRQRIGIDIEEIRPRSESLFNHLAAEEEWGLNKEKSWDVFFRYWTAKEAALKSVGSGISKLKECRIVSIPEKNHLTLEYDGSLFCIEQFHYQNHIISVVKDSNSVEWITYDL